MSWVTVIAFYGETEKIRTRAFEFEITSEPGSNGALTICYQEMRQIREMIVKGRPTDTPKSFIVLHGKFTNPGLAALPHRMDWDFYGSIETESELEEIERRDEHRRTRDQKKYSKYSYTVGDSNNYADTAVQFIAVDWGHPQVAFNDLDE